MVISTSSSPIIKCLSPHPPPPPPPFLPPIHPPPHLHPHPHPHPSNHSISPLRRLRRNSISVTPIPQHSLPIRILVADDSYVNCKLLAEFCIQLRVDVEFSANGQECYEKFMACQTIRQEKTNITWNGETTEIGTILTQPPTIILMDLDMPIMNGLICTERIRSYEQQHQLTKTPIISLSASTPNQHIDGMDASLRKPVSIHTLRDCIVTWAEHVHRLNMSGSTPSVIATAQDKTITATHCQVSSPIQALHVRTMTMTRSTPNIQRRLNNCNLDLIPSICMSSSYSSFHPPLSHSSLNSSSNSSSSSSSCCSCCSSPPSSSPSHRRDHNSCIEYSPTSSPLLPCTTFGKSNNSCNHESLTNQCTQQYHHPIARPDASHRHIQLLQRTYPSISESTPQARRSSISKIVRCATPYVFG